MEDAPQDLLYAMSLNVLHVLLKTTFVLHVKLASFLMLESVNPDLLYAMSPIVLHVLLEIMFVLLVKLASFLMLVSVNQDLSLAMSLTVIGVMLIMSVLLATPDTSLRMVLVPLNQSSAMSITVQAAKLITTVLNAPLVLLPSMEDANKLLFQPVPLETVKHAMQIKTTFVMNAMLDLLVEEEDFSAANEENNYDLVAYFY